MPLAPGRRLGPYEIVSSLGAGGMGEVYEARDTRLGRTVAIKVLPEDLADDPARRARFEREARAVSQLAHPHVCTLYDVGEAEGLHFLVLEHCEGETLAGRLERGALPLAETLRVGAEIAEALDAAHRQGVTHRDLKPANVVLTSSGAKLLDFGLARLAAGGTGTGDDLPTLSADADPALTAEGTVLGTYPYMAPEQVEGVMADARSDLFSLGTVLHEMATGRRAFEGRSAASIMAAVLKEEPEPLSRLQPMTPPALDHVVSRCLAKDPEERWQSAKDVAVELRWVAGAGSQAGVAAPVARRRKSRERVAWGVAALAMVGIMALGILLWARPGDEPALLVQAEISQPAGLQLDVHRGLALSPDGTQLVVSVGDPGEGKTSLWIRPLGATSGRLLPGTEGAEFPFWSPDGRHLGFFAAGRLERIAVAGGPPRTLSEAPMPRGGAWGDDGSIVFNGSFREGLFIIPAAGGEPRELTRIDRERGEISHRWPHFLPGAETLLFLVQRAEGGTPGDESTIEALDLATGKRTSVVRANSSMAYSPSGHLLFWRDGSLLAQRFDSGDSRLTGEPEPLFGEVDYSFQERASFVISRGGTLVYQRSGSSGGPSQLAWFDRAGQRLEDVGSPQKADEMALSHSGDRVAFVSDGDVWIRDLDSGALTRLTFHGAPDQSPVWSPDDGWIAFMSLRDRVQGGGLFRKRTSGEGEAELLLEMSDEGWPNDWSPSGEQILFQDLRAETEADLRLLDLADGTAEDLLRSPAAEFFGRFSPDGRWIAFNSARGLEFPDVFVTGADEARGRWQLSRRGGVAPKWSSDGREIFYLEPPNRLMVVEVSTEGGFRHGPPRTLFEVPEGFQEFDVHPDGERFLLRLAAEVEGTAPPLEVVVNWPELLRR